MSALAAPRGTRFIRLAIAAVFLVGFLGIAGYLFKDVVKESFASSGVEIPGISSPAATPNVPSPNVDTPIAEGTPVVRQLSSSSGPDRTNTSDLVSSEPTLPVSEAKTLDQQPTDVPPRAIPASEEEIRTATQDGVAMGKGSELTPPSIANELQPSAPLSTQEKLLEVPMAPESRTDSPIASTSDRTSQLKSPASDHSDVPEKALPALEALQAFLSSPTVAERARHTLGADVMKPLMDRYYLKMNDGPITVDHVGFSNFEDSPELGAGAHCIFRVESKAWEYPVPVMLEKQADGWKVDWLAFVELKDRKLEEFFKGYTEGRFMFHVGIYRQHYFEDAVPNRDQKDAFSVGLERPNPFRAPVFLAKDTPLSQNLATRLPWETHVWAIVELEWKKLGSQQWVELVSMPQMHWHSVPAAPRPISTPEQPKTPLPPTGAPKATPGSEQFPPGIRRSPATGR